MPDGPVPKASQAVSLKQRYINFWKHVETTTRTGGGNLNDRIESKVEEATVAIQTVPDRSLALNGVPVHPKNRSDLADLRLRFRQKVTASNEIVASNVQVTYLRPVSGKDGHYEILESWHYDFAPNVAAHPIFHAQLGRNHALDERADIHYVEPLRAPAPKGLPRIPTPPMDMPGVGLLVMADHFPSQLAEVDGDDWRRVVNGLPRFPASCFEGRGDAAAMAARWWYPR